MRRLHLPALVPAARASYSRGSQPCKAAGKPFIAYEYGWDRTNYPTLRGLGNFLETLRRTPEIAGDAFWALQSHNDGHGWMPIPADSERPDDRDAHSRVDSGGLCTTRESRRSSAHTADMSARAQAIRRHDYAMRGMRVPAHAIPPAPTVTSVQYGPTSFIGRVGAHVYWQGSAGAMDYSVERAATAHGPWITVCRRCVTDVDDGYADVSAAANDAWFRVIPYNLDGKRGPASAAMQASPG